jgi:hypothetical protein
MHINTDITLANILAFMGMIIGAIFGSIKFMNEVNKKANKEDLERIRSNQEILLLEIKAVGTKVDKVEKKLDEYIEKQNNINKDFYIIQSDHKKNH